MISQHAVHGTHPGNTFSGELDKTIPTPFLFCEGVWRTSRCPFVHNDLHCKASCLLIAKYFDLIKSCLFNLRYEQLWEHCKQNGAARITHIEFLMISFNRFGICIKPSILNLRVDTTSQQEQNCHYVVHRDKLCQNHCTPMWSTINNTSRFIWHCTFCKRTYCFSPCCNTMNVMQQ